MRRGEQVVYLYTQTWRSRIPWLTPSVYVVASGPAPSASGCPATRHFPCEVSTLYFTVSPLGMPTATNHPVTHVQNLSRHFCPLILSSSLAPYSIPPSVFILTGYGVVFQRGRDIVRLDLYLMLWTGGSFLLALLLTRRRFVFRALFSHI